MKFLFMDGRKYKAIHTELSRVLKGHALSVDVCKYWCRNSKAGKASDRLSGALMSLVSDEPFLSARVLAVRLSSMHHTINGVLVSDLGMQQFVR
jgi:hypothetical protein